MRFHPLDDFRDDVRRWLTAENEGSSEWVGPYTRPTNLKTPLQSVMEWEGKRSITEIINTDLRFQKTTLQGNNNSSQITVTIYFAWKPDSLQASAEQEAQEEEDISASKRAKKGKGSKVERRRPSPGSPGMRKRPGGFVLAGRRNWKKMGKPGSRNKRNKMGRRKRRSR